MGRCVWPMAAPNTIGIFSGSENAFADILDRGAVFYWGSGIREIAKDNAANAIEFPGLLKVHERAIELIGTHAAIFEHENGAGGVDFPRSAKRGLEKRDAAAEKAAIGDAVGQRFAGQRNFPAGIGVADGLQERVFVVAVGIISATIETQRRPWGHKT